MLNTNETNDQNFYVDSRVTTHMINDTCKLHNAKPYSGLDVIYVGDGNKLSLSHIGDVSLSTTHGTLKLKDEAVVPKPKKNLLSMSQLTSDNHCVFEFTSFGFVIKD